ncbi:MAG: DUF1189 family protein [bacterium]|nr:DUF1189 family protein [bacterium]
MKTIFETFKKSIYNPAFYQSVAGEPLSLGLRYYAKVALLLSIVMTIALSVLLIPAGVLFVKKYAPEMVRNYFPAELSVHIEKGIATANVPMPYFVSLHSITGATATATSTDAMQNMLVIDTTKDFDKKKFEEYKTYALLSNTDIATKNDNGQITIQSLRMVPTMTVNQEALLGWVEKIQNYTGRIVLVGVVGTFIVVALGFVMYLIPLLLFALIPLLVAYIKKTPLSYASAYKMSVYAIVPALVLKTLLNVVGIFFIPPYFTFLVFLLIISLNMRETAEPTLFESK